MGQVAVIGEELRIQGFALAGALTCPAADAAAAREAWRRLSSGVDVAILTASAARWLADDLALRPDVLTVVMPP